MRVVAQSLLATVIPTQIVTSDADFGLYQGDYILVNSRFEKLLIRIADELVEYSLLMRHLSSRFRSVSKLRLCHVRMETEKGAFREGEKS
jgi:hypothetical protein